MNILEEINLLLQKYNKPIKYGVMTDEVEDILIGIEIGSDKNPVYFIGTANTLDYPLLKVTIYSNDYIDGYELALLIAADIKSAVITGIIKQTGSIGSEYDKDLSKYLFILKFKQIN